MMTKLHSDYIETCRKLKLGTRKQDFVQCRPSARFEDMLNSEQLFAPFGTEAVFGAVHGPAAISTPPPASESQTWRFAGKPTATMFVPTPDGEYSRDGRIVLMNVSAMPPFESYSPEELRIQHYKYLKHVGNEKKPKGLCGMSLQPPEPSAAKGTNAPKLASCFGVSFDKAGFGAKKAPDEGTSRSTKPSQAPAAFPTPTAPPMPVATEAVPTSSPGDGIGIPVERNAPSTDPSGTDEALPGIDASGSGKPDNDEPDTSSTHVVQISTDEADGKVCTRKDDNQQSGGDGLCTDGLQIPSADNTSTSRDPQAYTSCTANKGNYAAADSISGAGTSSPLFQGGSLSGLFEKMNVGGSLFKDQNGGKAGDFLSTGPSESLFGNMTKGGLFETTQSGTGQPSVFGDDRQDNGSRTDGEHPLSMFLPAGASTGPQNRSTFSHNFKGFTADNNTRPLFTGGPSLFVPSVTADSALKTTFTGGLSGAFHVSSPCQNSPFQDVRHFTD